MRTVRLIIASLRLAWSPSSRPVIICLLVFALLLPLATLLLVPTPDENQHLPTVRISVISDESGDDMLDTIQTELGKIDLIEEVYTESLEQAKARLEAGETLLYIQFPSAFFADSLAALKREQVEVVLNKNMPAESEFFARMADEITVAVVDLTSAYYAYGDLMRPYFATPEALQRHLDLQLFGVLMRLLTRNRLITSQDAPKFDIVAFISASMLVVLILLAGLLPLFFTARDDKLGLSARFLASGLSDGQIQMARLISALPFILLASVPLLLVVSLAFRFTITPRLLLSLFALYTSQALISLIVARLNTRHATPILLAFGLTFAHMVAGGVIYPAELLPHTLARWGHYAPAAYTHRLAFKQFSGSQDDPFPYGLLISCLVLTLLLLISGRLCRRRRT